MSRRQPNFPPVLLASASPRRAELLRQMGVSFRVAPTVVHELAPPHLSPAEIAMNNAYRKAHATAQRHPNVLVLGADTVVSVGRIALGKPADMTEARQMLGRLQGKTHYVITGVCLIHGRTRRQRLFAVHTAVTFRQLTPAHINRYLAEIDPLDKAGGYAIQESGDRIVKSIQGSFSNVVGLPVERLRKELANW